MTVSVCTENPMIDEDIRLFSEALSRDDEMLAERLHLLSNLLQEMGYGRRSRDEEGNESDGSSPLSCRLRTGRQGCQRPTHRQGYLD